MLKRLLHREDKGIGAVEFALVAPVLISFIIGISQMGRLFFANADMKNAAAHGARVASVWPVPDDATIIAAVNNRLARTGARSRATATVVRDEDDNGNSFVEVRISYTVPLEFIFFEMPPITLTDTRRVFTQVTEANDTTYTDSSSTTTGGSTSATSASSAGGTTSATSASSTSTSTSTSAGGTSTTTTTSTTSSGNASSGNASSGNNGSSGHNHGDCKNKC